MSEISTSQGQKIDLVHTKGDTFALSLDVTDSAGVDYSFTGYSAELSIYDRSTDIQIYSFTSEITLTTGNIAINVPATSLKLPLGGYGYSLRLTVGANVYTWLYGSLAIVRAPDVGY